MAITGDRSVVGQDGRLEGSLKHLGFKGGGVAV
jgi:hypothetical protein